MDVYSELEKFTKDSLKLLVLKSVGEGKRQAQEIIEFLRESGLGVAQSTVYTALKDLEKEGLIKAEGTRNKKYELTEEGKRVLEENKLALAKFEDMVRKAKVMKVLGVKDLLDAINDVMKVMDELGPEERAEVAVAVSAATGVLRKIASKHVKL